MRSLLGVLVGACLAMTLLAAPAHADDAPVEPAAPTVSFAKTAYKGVVGLPVALSGTYEGVENPATVVIQRIEDGVWAGAADKVTASSGRFDVTVKATATVQKLRVRLLDGDGAVLATSDRVTLTGTAAKSTLRFTLPTTVVDYKAVTLRAKWRTADGRKPAGLIGLQFKRDGSKTYASVGSIRMKGGSGWKTMRPRDDGRYRVAFPGSPSIRATTAASRHIDNLPPGKVVHLPKGSARPTVKLPAQRRAARADADAKISKLSDAVWSSMKGRTWHKGCPIGRATLRMVRVSYWGFDGYVHRGEIVVNRHVAKPTAKIFTDLFDGRTPIRSMYREDRFGWSESLKGADDLESMRADNTSGFNCRQQVGWVQYRSPHAYGKSIDLNTWENPFASHSGYRPNASWAKRSKPASITWRGADDSVVKIFRKHGFRWLGKADLQHFQD